MKFLNEKEVLNFINKRPRFKNILKQFSRKESFVLKSIITINQAKIVFEGVEENKNSFDLLKKMAQDLLKVEKFYKNIGGIIGYFEKSLALMDQKKEESKQFLPPPFFDISKKTSDVDHFIQEGIKSLDIMAEIYPVGGAGDRFNLLDEKTNIALPIAKLKFLGKSLLEHLILDLRAREYLYYKYFKKEIITPIVIMTSDSKNNHNHILEILEENNYFRRPKKSFFFFKQFLNPVITKNKNFAMEKELTLLLKPSGHGVLWKLMKDNKVFDWLYDKKKEKVLVRQINNVVAGVDYGLLAFLGYGVFSNKKFGVACCERKMNAPEGLNVLFSKNKKDFTISNIEYTDFKKFKIDEKFLTFPANTNILFVDLKSAENIISKNPFLKMIFNMKTDAIENEKKVKSGRIEHMMQNVSDYFYGKKERLSVFITFNRRTKTISTIKKPFILGKNISNTPMNCFLDVFKNYFDLLFNHCKMDIKNIGSEQEFIKKGPPFFCYLHPTLGPLFTEISKKIVGGKIQEGSELILEISEILMKNIYLDGSMQIIAKNITGKKSKNSLCNEFVSKCFLRNTKIINSGIDYSHKNEFWKNKIKRNGTFRIRLEGYSIFEAENITFEGNFDIRVPDGHKIIAYNKGRGIKLEKIKLTKARIF